MPALSIFREFSSVVKSFTVKPAIFFTQDKKDLSFSYSELNNQILKLGNFLYSQGIRQQDRVAMLLLNEPSWPISFMALQYIGAVAVPLDYRMGSEGIAVLFAHSQAKALLCSGDIYSRYKSCLEEIKGLKIFLIDSPQLIQQIALSSPELLHEEMPQDVSMSAAIFYTSGTTTSSPKAVILSQKSLLSGVSSIKSIKLIQEKDIFISILPLHHVYSFMVNCLLPLLHGAGISYPAGYSSEELLYCIKNTNVSILVGVPQFFGLIHRNIKDKFNKLPFIILPFFGLFIELLWVVRKSLRLNLSKYVFFTLHRSFGKDFRMMISGGAKIDNKVICDFFKWGFLILEGYGLSESSVVATLNIPQDLKIGSVGRPLPGVDIKIMSANLAGIGEIALKGRNLLSGYLNNPEAERAMCEGWLFTGDMGYFDKKGYLYIKGRQDELIVLSSGQKVSPAELEKHYSSSPYIKEICVFASEKTGMLEGAKQLAAIVVPNEEYFRKRGVINTEEKIRWELDNRSHHLRDFKRVKGFAVSKEALPRTIFGKIMRRRINDEYFTDLLAGSRRDAALGPEDSVILSIEIYKNLFDYLSERLQKKVKLDDHLELDLGLDSLNRVELLLELQTFLNMEVPDSLALELFYCSTIRELVAKINPFLPEKARTASIEKIQWSDILSQKPPEEKLKSIRLQPLFMDRVLAFLFLGFLQFLCRVFFLYRIKGKENLPKKGPYMIYANHTSYLDGFLVLACLPMKVALNTYFVGFREYLLHPLAKSFIKTARLIPIDPVLNLVATLQVCAYLFKKSKIICYFPEGERSSNGEIAVFKKGVGILIKELSIPLVPIYIDGAFKAWSRYDRFPKWGSISLTVGKKITHSDLVSKAGQEKLGYESLAQNLRDELVRLKYNNPHS